MPSPLRTAWLPVAVFLLFATSACVPRTLRDDSGPREEERAEEVDLSQYEDFDPAPYAEPAPAAREDIEHDVPARLLSGNAAEGVARTVQGFRVQILSSRDKGAAEDAAAQAEQWWQENAGGAPSNLFAGTDLPVYTIFRQPYYRVRVGNFTSRANAQRALDFLNQRYTDAFIARDEVTVTE